jgi:glutathione S-transferase
MLLDLLRVQHELVDVPYSDRSELARLTEGYIYVPVMLWDDGSVTVESRTICQQLLDKTPAHELVPSPFQGPIWAYADFCDGPLEDVLFRIASPGLHHAWQDPGDRALFALIKERKFGAGCVAAWQRDQSTLIARGRTLLEPTFATLRQQPFVFGERPTLADAALYGELAMLAEADPELIGRAFPELGPYQARLELAGSGGSWQEPRLGRAGL